MFVYVKLKNRIDKEPYDRIVVDEQYDAIYIRDYWYKLKLFSSEKDYLIQCFYFSEDYFKVIPNIRCFFIGI